LQTDEDGSDLWMQGGDRRVVIFADGARASGDREPG